MNAVLRSPDYPRIAEAIRYIQEHRLEQPDLAAVAAHLGLSPHHLQRVFQHWAGISPKRLLQFFTVEHAKNLLQADTPVLETSLATGLSGPGRLHDLFVTIEAATPGEYRSGGAGLLIRFGFTETPFGRALIASTERGLCSLAFCDPDPDEEVLAEARSHWPRARWQRDDSHATRLAREVFARLDQNARAPLALLVRGTNFQVNVWRALLQIPEGRLVTYSQVAATAGRPRAVRAAASAVGDNPIAWLIPCHRVIRTSGMLGGYRWGLERKSALIAWESARTASA